LAPNHEGTHIRPRLRELTLEGPLAYARGSADSHSQFRIPHSAFRNPACIARDLGILSLLVICSHVPFLWRPFHIDDRIYWEISRQAAKTPLYPQDYAPMQEGKGGPDAASHSHPPLISYILAGLRAIGGGEKEPLAHSVFLIFPLFLAAGVYLLALDRIRFPIAAALLSVWNPAVYVLSQSVMTDVPFLALLTFGIALYLFGENRGVDLRWFAALSLTLAAMANYVALAAVPLLLVVQWRRRASIWRLWPVILMPLATVAGWLLLQSVHYRRFILTATVQFLTREGHSKWWLFGQKTLSGVLNLGGLALVLVLFSLRTWKLKAVWLAIATPGAVMIAALAHWHWLHCILFGAFLASGILALWKGFEKPLDPTLHLWLLGFLISLPLIYYHGSVRYVLPLLVPVVLLLLRGEGWTRQRIKYCVAATWLHAALIAHADYQFASIYPEIADLAFESYPVQRVWTAGEWGFRYYMERQGAKTLSREDQRPGRGDIIVKPYLAMPYLTGYDDDAHLDLLRREFVYLSNPIRILDFESHAGFYSTGWGILPWSVAVRRKEVEIFNFFGVKKQFEGYKQKLKEDYYQLFR
jgi:4-amino-4-deoxy-L-arabinose transferase-like glycosyltransferase